MSDFVIDLVIQPEDLATIADGLLQSRAHGFRLVDDVIEEPQELEVGAGHAHCLCRRVLQGVDEVVEVCPSEATKVELLHLRGKYDGDAAKGGRRS